MQDRLILNRYRPITQAGAGGFGTVQVAWDTRIQRRVAIKCMQFDRAAIAAGLGGVEESLDREYAAGGIPDYDAASIPGLEEARTAAMLSDPNIVGVLDFEVQGDIAYLIMEYVDGITLTQLLRDHADRVSLDVVSAVFSGVAHALKVAHENQVLHLDIKPDNVLINRQGQVKVTDFGLSKLSGVTGYAQAGGGTIGYMPLEQMRLEPVDVRCDEWALASMTYEMLSGENPFLAKDIPQAEAAIEDAELVLPSLCMDGLDSQVDDVLFYALDPNREERYDTVEDFAEELQPFLGDAVAGRKQLAVIVGDACEDIEEEEEPPDKITRLDRVRPASRGAFMRIWSVANCGVLGFVSLANIAWFQGIESLTFWGVLALLAVAAALVPHLGALLAVLALAVALFSHGAYISGTVLVVAAAAWWFGVARFGKAQPNTALSPALFGAFGCGQITPLLCGFMLDMRQTVLNTLFAGLLAILLASMGSMSLAGWSANIYWQHLAMTYEQTLLLVLQQPSTWISLASWVLAALIVSACCIRESRGVALAGMVLAGAVLMGGVMLTTWLGSAMTSFVPDALDIVRTVIPVLAGCLFTLLGVPARENGRR